MTELSPYWVFMATSQPFDYVNPRPGMIEPRALAWQLSGEGRWANNTHFHLSVAQHSLIVANAISNPAYRIYGLLHDAAEAFTRDLPTPLKHWMTDRGADIGKLEDDILGAVWERFDLVPPSDDVWKVVKDADARALATEYRDVVMGKGPEWVPDGKPLPGQAIRFRERYEVMESWLTALDSMLRDARRLGMGRLR